ncbi:hypothetical protein ICN19_08265 [Polynucleobacter sp. AP-Capit-er-40B-B4]|uniref:hypothetical protein n=1 Tax=Polynucleobacter sp. AP-Capit-er-40B-B4 TaxID=2576927 RepID=UPI001C0C04FC|nr:hypothetical protein [Polynucleobacter sp. AP-Capit-er-40B-B4]MBU3582010.1 hypothetical protein [Polynucleobacter sp. AP-Capit-er-40B-B4]
MSIKQFNATYLAPDDRLLFRFNTTEDTEFRFWFTRRITLFILAATQHLTVKSLEQTHAPEIAKAIADFDKEVMQSNPESQGVSKAEAYQPAANYPLGADPLLVMDAKCTPEKQGSEDGVSLDLVLPGGANINVKMAGPTLQALCALLNQLREHAKWGDIPLVAQSATGVEILAEEGKKPSVH